MAAINSVVDLSIEGEVALVTINSPPVNALSQAVRDGLKRGVEAAEANGAAKAIVIICDGRTFIAGADISEFGKPPAPPSLHEALDVMENASKPVIAAIHGTALGGGLEVALAAHYRIAVPSAKCGLPEIKLGILPGAGGTQRLPRLIGPEKALDVILSGTPFGAREAKEWGVVDEIAEEGKLRIRRSPTRSASSPKRRRLRRCATDRTRSSQRAAIPKSSRRLAKPTPENIAVSRHGKALSNWSERGRSAVRRRDGKGASDLQATGRNHAIQGAALGSSLLSVRRRRSPTSPRIRRRKQSPKSG